MGYHMCGTVRRKMSPSGVLYIYDVSKAACERVV